jgi:hypothetical protein
MVKKCLSEIEETRNPLFLSSIALLLVVASQGVNFVDAIVSFIIKSGFIMGKKYSYTSVLFSSFSLLLALGAFFVFRKFYKQLVCKYIFFILLPIIGFIYVFEIQFYSTRNLSITLFRYKAQQHNDLQRNRIRRIPQLQHIHSIRLLRRPHLLHMYPHQVHIHSP